jgi:ADP-heptose:LPS heptosyltransferase
VLALCEPAARHEADPARRLVIQLARLGDFLQTTPLLAALGRPDVLVTPAQAPLARASRHAGRVLVAEPARLEEAAAGPGPRRLRLARLTGLVAPLAAHPVEEVLNLNLSPLCAALAAAWPGARVRGWRRGEDGRLRGESWMPFMLGLVADRRLTRLHLCDVLASYAGPQGPPLTRLDHQVSDEARRRAGELAPAGRPLVALQLGANHDLRRWPVESFAGLARGLAAEGARLVLVGSARERVLARRLARELGPAGEAVRDLMGRTDLAALGAVLARADLVVSADTGTLHLATAVGAPALALYMGPAQAHETGPYGAGHLVLQARDRCGPCQEDRPACGGEAPCRRLITPRAALAAATALLAGQGPAAAAAGLELPAGVEPLAGVLDGFGQRYQALAPAPLELAAGLALALREAGRVLLRPAYAPAADGLAAELAAEHRPPAQADARDLAGLARAARGLAGAALSADAAAARRLAARAPGLKALAGLVGPEAPPRLARACRAAAEVLGRASSL